LLKNAIEFNEFCKISTEEMLPAMLGAADYMPILKSVTIFLDNYIISLKRFLREIMSELGQRLKSELEGMRVKKLVSARMCEYIYLL
jgi:hypothetical protein